MDETPAVHIADRRGVKDGIASGRSISLPLPGRQLLRSPDRARAGPPPETTLPRRSCDPSSYFFASTPAAAVDAISCRMVQHLGRALRGAVAGIVIGRSGRSGALAQRPTDMAEDLAGHDGLRVILFWRFSPEGSTDVPRTVRAARTRGSRTGPGMHARAARSGPLPEVDQDADALPPSCSGDWRRPGRQRSTGMPRRTLHPTLALRTPGANPLSDG